MLQKFYNGGTAALDRLTKAVEKQTIEPKRIDCHLKRPRSKSLVRYQFHGDKRYRQFIMVFLCRSCVHENIEQLKEGVMWLRIPPPVFFLYFLSPLFRVLDTIYVKKGTHIWKYIYDWTVFSYKKTDIGHKGISQYSSKRVCLLLTYPLFPLKCVVCRIHECLVRHFIPSIMWVVKQWVRVISPDALCLNSCHICFPWINVLTLFPASYSI